MKTNIAKIDDGYDKLRKELFSKQKQISSKDFEQNISEIIKCAGKENIYYDIEKNEVTIGVYIPIEIWEDFLEDLESMYSKEFWEKINESRKK